MYTRRLYSSKESRMSLHDSHTMHENSLTAYREERPKLNGRKQMIFDYYCRNGSCTDREVMSGLGFKDMNAVRPRINEMIEMGVLREEGGHICDITGKRVRVVGVNYSTPVQEKLF